MKRYLLIAVVVGLVAVFAIVGVTYAQGVKPTAPVPGQGWGPGMMGRGAAGYGGMMGRGGANAGGYGRGGMMGAAAGQGYMHEYMEAALADKLGMTQADYEKLVDQGQTFWQIASDKGLTAEQAQQMMLDARNVALDKMVADGAITQAQADFMKTRMQNGWMGGGAGGCMGGAYPGGTTTGTSD